MLCLEGRLEGTRSYSELAKYILKDALL
jgi:hypothetical protein